MPYDPDSYRAGAEAMREAAAQEVERADRTPGGMPADFLKGHRECRIAAAVNVRALPIPDAPAEPSAPVAEEPSPWEETARHYAQGQDYYRGLLDQIGARMGPPAYTADDGSISDEVLRAKLPEVVDARITALKAEVAALHNLRRARALLQEGRGNG